MAQDLALPGRTASDIRPKLQDAIMPFSYAVTPPFPQIFRIAFRFVVIVSETLLPKNMLFS